MSERIVITLLIAIIFRREGLIHLFSIVLNCIIIESMNYLYNSKVKIGYFLLLNLRSNW